MNWLKAKERELFMKPLTGYAEAKATSFEQMERLPIGGYVVQITNLREENYSWGDVIVLAFDIFEGEYKGYFAKQFASQSDEYKKWKGTYRLNIPAQKGNTDDDKAKYSRSLGFFKAQIEAFNNSSNIKIDCSKEWDINVLKGKVVGALFGNKEWEYNGRTGWFTNCDHLIDAAKIRSGEFTIPKDKPLQGNSSNSTASIISDTDGELTTGEVPF